MDQECSACGRVQPVDGRYCPYCGTDRQASGQFDDSVQPKKSYILHIIVVLAVVFMVIPWLLSVVFGLGMVSYFGSSPMPEQPVQVSRPSTPEVQNTQTSGVSLGRGSVKAPKHISGLIRTYNGNTPVNTPHQFMSMSKYRIPGMKIYVKVGAGVYTYHAAYISDDGIYCDVRFPDGSVGRMENRVLDGLCTDYLSPR
ncbi:MAG: hypothetical protein ACYC1M_17600 [Armatimonadota bacterium]